MKKPASVILCFLFILSISACSGGSKDERSIDTFKSAYENAGYELKDEGIPIFQMIGAVNGTLFYIDNSPVKIYEYESTKTLEQCKKDYPLIKDWPVNGKFVLEASNSSAIDVFTSVK